MRKIKSLLLLCFFLLVNSFLYAQTYMETFAVTTGDWSKAKNDWIWDPMT